jgi:hypothetical protein
MSLNGLRTVRVSDRCIRHFQAERPPKKAEGEEQAESITVLRRSTLRPLQVAISAETRRLRFARATLLSHAWPVHRLPNTVVLSGLDGSLDAPSGKILQLKATCMNPALPR